MFGFHPSKVATVKHDLLSGLTVALAVVRVWLVGHSGLEATDILADRYLSAG